MSYSEESGRYKQLEPVFYIPPRDRPMIQDEGFKSARPGFKPSSDEEHRFTLMFLKHGYEQAYIAYEAMLRMKVDRGLARDVLGVGIYSTCYVTCNPRSIMAFLSLRTYEPSAKFVSYPLWEIEVAARKLEEIFKTHWPVTHKAFNDNGRVGP